VLYQSPALAKIRPFPQIWPTSGQSNFSRSWIVG